MRFIPGWLVGLIVGGFLGAAAFYYFVPADNAYLEMAFGYSEPEPEHQVLKIKSSFLNETRIINVSLPKSYLSDETKNYPVLYMPDGGMREDFPHIVYSVRQMANDGQLPELIVVGIENTLRQKDLTGPTEIATDRAIAERVGESDRFRQFLREELKPQITEQFRCSGESAIIGESLAGLFVTETFLKDPELFDRYVAISPSLWWNQDELVRDAQSWLAQQGATAQRRLFLCAANETDIAPQTEKLASVLTEFGPDNLEWCYRPRLDLTHPTIFRAMKKSGLSFAFQDLHETALSVKER